MCLKKPQNIIEDSSIVFPVSKTAFILQKPISSPIATLLRCNPLKGYLNILNTLNKLFLPLIKIPYLSDILIWNERLSTYPERPTLVALDLPRTSTILQWQHINQSEPDVPQSTLNS